MKFYPESAPTQLEFKKIQELLISHCRWNHAIHRAENLRIHTHREYIEPELRQSYEYKLLFQNHLSFPDDVVLVMDRELKLLSIPGSMLAGDQFLQIRKLTASIHQTLRWFDAERRLSYPALASVLEGIEYEKAIPNLIDEVLDETGVVKDRASDALAAIRQNLYKKRTELKRAFDRVAGKLKKQGYLTDIEESFLNGRRVLAVFAEQKRFIKGILHGESDSRRTSFIEPAETIALNNDVFSLENDERKEVHRILTTLTARLRSYHSVLLGYYTVLGEFDFIRAKARLALQYRGNMPALVDHPLIHLRKAYHPLLLIYNNDQQKPTVPLNLELRDQERILVISGPNAGGKTVTLKTVGLLQIMIQTGLLVPCEPDSEFGIFKQLMIHIGDTQSLEFELSTYSSHLQNMKHFMENANGKTLFFIDELGSGSDPNLGGAFAEVIMEELARKRAFGIVTTHYLNLKVMAGKVKGIVNGAMAFDEKNLQPLYRLILGKPGSSYTFAIAERIGLSRHLIDRAKRLVDQSHFKLDSLLNDTEQDLQQVEQERKQLKVLLAENEKLKRKMEQVIEKESHTQQLELLREQNRIKENKYEYMKDMERKLKVLMSEWRKAEDKNKVVKMMHATLYKQPDMPVSVKKATKRKVGSNYVATDGDIEVGSLVLLPNGKQAGKVNEIRGKKAIVQLGTIPITVSLSELTAVREKESPAPQEGVK